jgi:hypothetical protein
MTLQFTNELRDIEWYKRKKWYKRKNFITLYYSPLERTKTGAFDYFELICDVLKFEYLEYRKYNWSSAKQWFRSSGRTFKLSTQECVIGLDNIIKP